MTTDPKDAEIARLTAANNALKGSLTVLDEGYRRVETERDDALAQVAALREVVAFHERLAVDPADLSCRDAQMRAEGRKEGLREAAGITLSHRERWRCAGGFEGYATGAKLIRDAILAAAEKGE